jgi:hypothetical protein
MILTWGKFGGESQTVLLSFCNYMLSTLLSDALPSNHVHRFCFTSKLLELLPLYEVQGWTIVTGRMVLPSRDCALESLLEAFVKLIAMTY